MAETAKTNELNQYEAMFLFPSGAATDMDATLKSLRSMIERHGGQVLVIKRWDERKLAYEVKKQKRGLFVITYFNAPGAAVTAIEREVNLSDNILRVMVTSAEHLNQDEMNAVEPQPIQPREERAPWDRPSYDRGPRDDRGPREDRGDRGPRAPRAQEPAEANKE